MAGREKPGACSPTSSGVGRTATSGASRSLMGDLESGRRRINASCRGQCTNATEAGAIGELGERTPPGEVLVHVLPRRFYELPEPEGPEELALRDRPEHA